MTLLIFDFLHKLLESELREGYSQVVGDGLLMSNPKRIERAIHESTCNALLVKVVSYLLMKYARIICPCCPAMELFLLMDILIVIAGAFFVYIVRKVYFAFIATL